MLLFSLAVAAAAVVVLVVASRTLFAWNGDPGWALQPAGPFVVEVGAVAPRGAAAHAGVLTGDGIDLRRQPFDVRVLAVIGPPAGRPLPVLVERGGRAVPVTIVPGHAAMRWDAWLGYLILLWMAAFAGVMAWRRAALREARLLSVMLACYVAGDALQFLTTPSAFVDIVAGACNNGGVLGAITLAALVRFASLFGRPPSPARRVVDGAAYAGAAVLALYGIVGATALGTAAIDPVGLVYGTWASVINDGSKLLAILAGAGAIAASRGFERQRVTWAVVSMGSLLAVSVLQDLVTLDPANDDLQIAAQTAVNVASLVAPIGLTYSVLSRRLLDVGFALNRAAVFSVLSVIVVGLFMAIEWAVGGWVVAHSGLTGTAVSIAIALGLGFSVRFIHARVDRVVDRVFFRKRHEQERALLRFAHQAAFVTDTRTLLGRTVSEVARHAGAGAVAVLTRNGGVFVCADRLGPAQPDVDENDPTIVTLRATGQAVDLHGRASALRGEYAFPMLSRGALVGVLACGLKRDGDAYAPDERDALTELAQCVGRQLDMLAADREADAALPALQAQFDALRADIRELIDVLRANSAAQPRAGERE